MHSLPAKIREKISELHDVLNSGAAERQKKFKYRIDESAIVFDLRRAAHHRKLKTKLLHFLRKSKLAAVITVPVIYSVLVPIILMDLFITIYQNICFRVYQIPLVKRSEYVVMDRKYLAYLNLVQKINCI